jgi:hypothetical protein
MTNIVHPERDAPIDHMKIHKDVVWVIRTLWSGAILIFLAAVWIAALAADVESNTKELARKSDAVITVTLVDTLKRIEDKIDRQAKEQKTVSDTVIRLETKVEALEKEAA